MVLFEISHSCTEKKERQEGEIFCKVESKKLLSKEGSPRSNGFSGAPDSENHGGKRTGSPIGREGRVDPPGNEERKDEGKPVNAKVRAGVTANQRTAGWDGQERSRKDRIYSLF